MGRRAKIEPVRERREDVEALRRKHDDFIRVNGITPLGDGAPRAGEHLVRDMSDEERLALRDEFCALIDQACGDAPGTMRRRIERRRWMEVNAPRLLAREEMNNYSNAFLPAGGADTDGK